MGVPPKVKIMMSFQTGRKILQVGRIYRTLVLSPINTESSVRKTIPQKICETYQIQ